MTKPVTKTDPRILNCPELEDFPGWAAVPREVQKLVLGPSPGQSDEKAGELPAGMADLPTSFAADFPKLTHLYLWQIKGLKSLPAMPEGLKCLDLRGCSDLAVLPELPAGLETLDVGQCAALERLPSRPPASLRKFFFNGCAGLEECSLRDFLKKMRSFGVEELDGSGTPAVTTLKEFPQAKLRKLVLKGCQNLVDASQLGAFPVLEHLNLGGCTQLTELQALPPKLEFLVLHGAENLKLFMTQDIGGYDRGADNENVVQIFRSRKKFGGELAVMPHAKLLLMGDGRVGKTTLAKRFQWEELDEAQREARPELKPDRYEAPTHKVWFSHWPTGLSLPKDELEALEGRAKTAKVELPKTADGHLAGGVRVWDFGGQEIYHHTHRIFAGEGSIFLLVWREDRPAPGPAPEGVPADEWEEWNRQRPLDYWLDYIYSMRKEAKVALVCTNCPDRMERKPDWRVRAPKHAKLELPSFFVDTLEEGCGQHTGYQRLVRWVREACGAEAKRIGILAPRFYKETSDLVSRWLVENERARQADEPGRHLLCPWADWAKGVRAGYHGYRNHEALELADEDVAAITDYLHQAGHLFLIRHENHRAVLVDQEWAAGLIYELLRFEGSLRRQVKRNGGWFYRETLEEDLRWGTLETMQRERLLAYMEECQVIMRIGQSGWQREGKVVFLASDKWLLPEYKGVEARVDEQMKAVHAQPGMAVLAKFEFGKLRLNEFDFRSLQAFLARSFGTQALYFRNGFQARHNDAQPSWCFRLRWLPDPEDPFKGRIDAVLTAREQQLTGLGIQIEDLLYAQGSPIAEHRPKMARCEAQPRDLSHEFFRSLRQEEYDVAVSSSGADSVEANAMVDALRKAGLKVNHYRISECRVGDRERVLEFMNSLRRQGCIVVLLSEGYLRNDPECNWYCAWELADAIRQLGDGTRKPAQTLVVFKETHGFAFARFNEIGHRLLKAMEKHFRVAYAELDGGDVEAFDYFLTFAQKFQAAIKPEIWTKFRKECGPHGFALNYASLLHPSDGQKPFAPLIDRVAKAAGVKLKPGV